MRKRAAFTWILFFTLYCVQAEVPVFTFVAVGDIGCGCDEQTQVAQRMLEWHAKHRFNTVVVMGDAIYGKSPEIRGGNRALFEERFDQYYQPLLKSGVKFYVALGNHDVETENGLHEILDQARFHILRREGYYVFSSPQKVDGKPLISFFALNSNTLRERGKDLVQVEWLQRALKEDKSMWKIAYFHHPIHTAGGAHQPELVLRERIESVLADGGINLVLNGHNHFYARMKPRKGVIHITSGGGGRPLYTPKMSESAAVVRKAHHFLYFEVQPDKLGLSAVQVSGALIDQLTIVRP